MKTINFKKVKEAYIWAPFALTGEELLPARCQLIKISNNRIESMAPFAGDELPGDVLRHKNFFCLADDTTLMPALIDAHVHLALTGGDFAHALAAWKTEDKLMERIREDLQVFHRHGIGAVRDGGDKMAINNCLINNGLINNEELSAPRIVSVGCAVRKAGGYGSFLGKGYHRKEELPQIVASLVSAGINQLKVLVSGIVSFTEYGRVGPVVIPDGELRYIVEIARRYGLKVMAHASSAEAVDLAVKAGVDSIEHGYFVRKDTLRAMALRNIAWVPTVIPVAIQVREPLIHNWHKQHIKVITTTFEEHLEKLSYACRAGVPLGMGTDSGAGGVMHGINLFAEMLLYARGGGLSHTEVIKAATVTNATILGLEKNMGAVEPGREPFLIAVKGNPLKNLQSLKKIEWFFKS